VIDIHGYHLVLQRRQLCTTEGASRAGDLAGARTSTGIDEGSESYRLAHEILLAAFFESSCTGKAGRTYRIPAFVFSSEIHDAPSLSLNAGPQHLACRSPGLW
jgi:hypothetical protein